MPPIRFHDRLTSVTEGDERHSLLDLSPKSPVARPVPGIPTAFAVPFGNSEHAPVRPHRGMLSGVIAGDLQDEALSVAADRSALPGTSPEAEDGPDASLVLAHDDGSARMARAFGDRMRRLYTRNPGLPTMPPLPPLPDRRVPSSAPADDELSTSEARKTGKGKAVDRPLNDTDAATGGTPPDGPDDPRRNLPPRLPDQETQRKQAAQVRKVLELARRAGWRDYGGVYGEILKIEDENLRQHLIKATKRIPVNDDLEKEKALRELEPLGAEQGVNNYHRSQLPVPELPADLGLDGLVDREAYAEWYRREGYDRQMHLLREGPAGPHGCRIGPGESYLWSRLVREPRGDRDLRSNGLDGSSRRVFRYDHSKSEFEVYDHKNRHLGAIDAVTGQWKQGKQVTGRREKHTYDDIGSGGKMVV